MQPTLTSNEKCQKCLFLPGWGNRGLLLTEEEVFYETLKCNTNMVIRWWGPFTKCKWEKVTVTIFLVQVQKGHSMQKMWVLYKVKMQCSHSAEKRK